MNVFRVGDDPQCCQGYPGVSLVDLRAMPEREARPLILPDGSFLLPDIDAGSTDMTTADAENVE